MSALLFYLAALPLAALTIAKMPARIASGSVGQAATTAASSEGKFWPARCPCAVGAGADQRQAGLAIRDGSHTKRTSPHKRAASSGRVFNRRNAPWAVRVVEGTCTSRMVTRPDRHASKIQALRNDRLAAH